MKSNNPLIKLERYRRICECRKEIMEEIENEIWMLEAPYRRVCVNGTSFHFRYCVEVNNKKMSREDRKRCKRLRNVRYKLNKNIWKLSEEILRIERRRGRYEYDDFTWKLFEIEAAEIEAAEAEAA